MELLSPAGGWESMVAAVQNGADAVYLGGRAFNARRSADNFDDAQMLRAVEYCHARSTKLNVTLNTMLFDRELQGALEYAAFLYEAGADALIVQDMGLISLLLSQLPALPLHASTQMGVHDLEGARLMEKLGFEQVVLSRETPLNEIQYISENTGVRLEVFAHGAMCVSFSGGCYMSAMAGERSGNRGTCAQPCRKTYSIGGKRGYLLSMADMCMLHSIGDIERAGAHTIKLEGRMKRPEYVAAVTRAYRAALDGASERELDMLERDMLNVFERGGIHKGYYYGADGIKTGCHSDSPADNDTLKRMRETVRGENRLSPLNMCLHLKAGEKALLTLKSRGESIEVCGDNVETAQKPPDTKRYVEQLTKLGDTPFKVGQCEIEMEGDCFMPVSALNALRREGVARLITKLARRRERVAVELLPVCDGESKAERPVICAKVRTVEQATAAVEAGADEILFEPLDYEQAEYQKLFNSVDNVRVMLALPNVAIDRHERALLCDVLQRYPWAGAQANAIGQIELIRDLPLKLAGAPFNAANRYSVKQLKRLGFDRIALSIELTKPQIRDIISVGGCGIEVYSRTNVMSLRHCPVKTNLGCKSCEGLQAGELTDEAGRIFKLTRIAQRDGCLIRVKNCAATNIIDLAGQLDGIAAWELNFDIESADEVRELVASAVMARKGDAEPVGGETITRGHWNRKVE